VSINYFTAPVLTIRTTGGRRFDLFPISLNLNNGSAVYRMPWTAAILEATLSTHDGELLDVRLYTAPAPQVVTQTDDLTIYCYRLLEPASVPTTHAEQEINT